MRIVFLVCIFLSQAVFSLEDLGTHGQSYDIKEKDLMSQITEGISEEKILEYKKNVNTSVEKLLNPTSEISACLQNNERSYEPIYEVPDDIKTADGRILYRKGYKFNVLEKMQSISASFSKYIIFIDSRDKVQKKLAQDYKEISDILIVSGGMNDFNKTEHDQMQPMIANKQLLDKFQVNCIPSVYEQKNNRFVIKEYASSELEKYYKAKNEKK